MLLFSEYEILDREKPWLLQVIPALTTRSVHQLRLEHVTQTLNGESELHLDSNSVPSTTTLIQICLSR